MASIVYALSTLTCIACAFLLLRSFKRNGTRLLLWSGLCFIGMALNNALATLDVNTPSELMDLSTIRVVVSIISVSILIYGLAWEAV
jgi:hypothetical protein